ncbi:MAG: hypothetical protein ABJL67_08015 [Sulfitobacter sp.]
MILTPTGTPNMTEVATAQHLKRVFDFISVPASGVWFGPTRTCGEGPKSAVLRMAAGAASEKRPLVS